MNPFCRARVGRLTLASATIALCAVPAAAQTPKPFDFSIKNIMRGPELYGRQPQNVRWSADSRWIYFTWLEPGTNWRETPKQFRVRAVAGSKPERVSLQQIDSTGSRFTTGQRSHNGRYAVVEFNGDLYINDLTAGTTRRLTQTVDPERSPQFSTSDREVFFVRNNNIFSIDLSTGFLKQVTDIRQGPAPADSASAQGQRGRLERQQRDLFESVRDRIRADSIARAERLQRDSLGLKAVYLLSGEQVADFSISPAGSRDLRRPHRSRARSLAPTFAPELARASFARRCKWTEKYSERVRQRSRLWPEQRSSRRGWTAVRCRSSSKATRTSP